MKIFVTGGTGFIGRRLVARLAQDKNNLPCLDKCPPSVKETLEWLKKEVEN